MNLTRSFLLKRPPSLHFVFTLRLKQEGVHVSMHVCIHVCVLTTIYCTVP